jgi:hypothetical protein
VDGRPVPLPNTASAAQRADAWSKFRGTGSPSIPKLTPYTYFTEDNEAGVRVAWFVARKYLAEHRQTQGMLWWHLSGAALTIWLTRNLSADELLTMAAYAG